ncbi:MAG: TMEM175 family protein, partial [Bacteroidota bacterium]
MIHSKPRLEAISDGIFAFAATLVVVSLDVPDSYAELRASLSQIASFAISFAALVLIWITHHNLIRRINGIDYWVMAYNFAMLFVMLCYVFPLKFLAKMTFGEATVKSYEEFTELFVV